MNGKNCITCQAKALVFTIALNGYNIAYRKNISSQKGYAAKYGFDYVAVTRPALSSLFMECAWLKLILILSALESGYEWVFFVDSDAEIKKICPDFRSLDTAEKYIYMAHGFSGRVNSGVIIVKNNLLSKKFLIDTLNGFDKVIPPEDGCGWGENGHVNHFSKLIDSLFVIPGLWNNTHDLELIDYVRHYTGPMREHGSNDLLSKFIGYISRAIQSRLQKLGVIKYSHEAFPERLISLYESTLHIYGRYFRPVSADRIFTRRKII
jgi:hypothetical protein